mmetsp:Transcript_13028/g.19654  ORF Transcript_13028/g.19654 Transcript_13028/m.19654 type:complete len:129 (+) Transcript_13028:39-425(+)
MKCGVDVVKVLLLAAMYMACLYSAFVTFSQPQQIAAAHLKHDYSLCNKLAKPCVQGDTDCVKRESVKLQECRKSVDRAYGDVTRKCAGYISKLQQCQIKTPNMCQTQRSNVERCANVILRSHLLSADA